MKFSGGPQRISDAGTPPLTVVSAGKILWRRKSSVAALALAGTALVALILTSLPPLYKSEATIEMSFNRDDLPQTTAGRQLASLDPGALINGAAQAIGSRTNAGRVVRRAGLDKAPAATSGAVTSFVQSLTGLLGFDGPASSTYEKSIDELIRNVKVTSKAHLYVIGIEYTDKSPDTAAKIANAFAVEYLRDERRKDLSSQAVTASAELAAISERLGERHPRRLQVEERVARLDAQLKELDRDVPDPRAIALSGQFLTPAEPVYTPVSRRKAAILALGASLSLSLAALATLLRERTRKQPMPRPPAPLLMKPTDNSTPTRRPKRAS